MAETGTLHDAIFDELMAADGVAPVTVGRRVVGHGHRAETARAESQRANASGRTPGSPPPAQPLVNARPYLGQARIGCSGWQYRHWRGAFYPSDLPQTRWLEYYASQFNTVEINNTFYRLPEASAFATWRKRVPPGFLYTVKASRFLTHMKKLKDPKPPLDRLLSRARSLGQALGPILYQLPPRWNIDVARLTAFLRSLPRRRLHAIEFRDPSWYTDEVFELLTEHQVACCVHDMAGSATGRQRIGPFVYARFHGPARYSGRYDDRTLDDWAVWLAAHLQEGRPVFAYFNNDLGGHAPEDALRLRQKLRAHE
jgi:uncharacterized protein YecE (DUF72 family)